MGRRERGVAVPVLLALVCPLTGGSRSQTASFDEDPGRASLPGRRASRRQTRPLTHVDGRPKSFEIKL